MAKKSELKKIIRQSLKKGVKRKEIVSSLSKLGYAKSDILAELGKKSEKKIRFSKGTIIRFDNVGKSFGENEVLKKVSFEIQQGDLFGLIGLSGGGKTTLLNMLIGFIEPDAGEINVKLIEGSEFGELSKKKKQLGKYFGFSSQNTSFYGKLTAKENLVHFANLYGIHVKEADIRADKLLEMIGLLDSKDKIADQLSGGMQKRLDIACSLVHNPKVLILDEPTADLDPFLRGEILSLVKKINEDGTTVVVASHFLQEIEHLCNRIAILHNKTVLKIYDPSAKSAYSKEDEIHVESSPGEYSKIMKTMGKKLKHEVEGHRLVIYTKDSIVVLGKLIKALKKKKEKLLNIKVEKPNLREMFEDIVEK